MKLITVSAADIPAALPMVEAIEAMKQAFAALSSGRVSAPDRGVIEATPPPSVALLMGASVADVGLGAKIVSVFPGNSAHNADTVNALAIALDPLTGEPRAIVDGTFLTAWRTGAASGAATDLLARQDVRTGAVIGAGVQARTQLLAIDCVRELETIRVFAPRRESVDAFVAEMQSRANAHIEAADSADEAVTDADVICTATNSSSPVFDGRLARRGTHVNGVGSFTLAMREVDAALVARASVFVDTVSSALAEAGDLVGARDEGKTRAEDWTELGLVAAGSAPGRSHPDEITFFKSVGHAAQDVAALARLFENAAARGLTGHLEL